MKKTSKIFSFLMLLVLALVLASCGGDTIDEIDQAPSFSVRVTFGSINISIDDITDADDNLMSFESFYALIDTETSGLRFYSADASSPEIFHAFEALNTLDDIMFDENNGIIEVQGDIELHSGAFAPGGSFEDFEVFKHDRAEIYIEAGDGAWEASEAVAVPYLSIEASHVDDQTRLILNGNQAYGTEVLSFLPSFTLEGNYSVDILTATGSSYINAKNNAKIVADLADEHIYVWFEWIDEYSEGIEALEALTLSFDNQRFTLSATKGDMPLMAAMTLYFMDGNIGTIQYLQIRYLGSENDAVVDVSPITGSGSETTIDSSFYTISHGDTLAFTDNNITAGDALLTSDILIGQFLEQLEKASLYQTWKITTEENRPLSPSVFGPALSKDPYEDSIADGDILSVLSSDWSTIRFYRLEVLDVEPYLNAINAADNAEALYDSLAEEVLKLEVNQNFKQHYFEAYQSSGYLDETTFEYYEGVKTFVEEVNQEAEAMINLLLDLNAAIDELTLLEALEALEDIEAIEEAYREAYWHAYQEANYTENDFIALEEVQAFVDEVNAYMQAREAKLLEINAAGDADQLLTAFESVDVLTDVNPEYKTMYYEAYAEEGYDSTEIFDAIEAVQGFIDGVNAAMDEIATLLSNINAATTSEMLINALIDEAVALENMEVDFENDYWTAYQHAGYDDSETFITIEEVQAFVDAVNEEVEARLLLLADLNGANSKTVLLTALKDSELGLDNVKDDYQDAYWEAYLTEGYDNANTFNYVEEAQAFVDAVNQAVEDEEPTSADLSDLNAASNADELLTALQALDLDNVISNNKETYWHVYQHEGYHQTNTFDSIQEAQGFVNGVNDHVAGN